jgi:ribosomal protein S18 acetylase RimI-like enzyme
VFILESCVLAEEVITSAKEMSVSICEMSMADYPVLLEIWQSDAGIGLGPGDDEAGIARYLKRNAGMSFVAKLGSKIIGTILAGHDGRRGYIYHLFVVPEHRGQKVGHQLLEHSLTAMDKEGIPRCIITVLKENSVGNDFWRAKKWTSVDFVNVYSTTLSSA